MLNPLLPPLFKGIALFTPAGDLVYGIDPHKQGHWHANLCAYLQELLGLPEPPHFLIPGYTATIDRWFDPQAQRVQTLAELYPPVSRYHDLLNAMFGTPDLSWQVLPWQDEACEPQVLESYRDRFPQLWQEHDLVALYEPDQDALASLTAPAELAGPSRHELAASYVLHLFVSGNSQSTERTLKRIHTLLERNLPAAYTLKVIDVFQHPEQAEREQVSATPTLLRVFPPPSRRIVGEFDDPQRVLQILATH